MLLTSPTGATRSGICATVSLPLARSVLALHDLADLDCVEGSRQARHADLFLNFDMLTSCNLRDFARVSLYLKANGDALCEAEPLRLIVQALGHWASFDYPAARRDFVAHIARYDCDVLAIFMLHMLDFCTGRTVELIDVLDRADERALAEGSLYPYYLAIKSFVLCERGDYDSALAYGLASFGLERDNIYAVHAITHAYHEMKDDASIIAFLREHEHDWIDNPGMRMHVYWHKAIAELGQGQPGSARASFDYFASMRACSHADQDLDIVGFLWRHKMAYPNDHRYDALWRQLADRWTGCIGASISYFHDLHAALCFCAANKPFLIKKMIYRSDGVGVPYDAHQVGVAILTAVYHYSAGNYAETVSILESTLAQWPKIGGSGAQRELLSLTLRDALLRCRTASPKVHQPAPALSHHAITAVTGLTY